MKITEVLSEAGIEREEIEIDVPAAADRDVRITLRSVTRNPSYNPEILSAQNPSTVVNYKAQTIPRPVWDNLIAALATQKAKASR